MSFSFTFNFLRENIFKKKMVENELIFWVKKARRLEMYNFRLIGVAEEDYFSHIFNFFLSNET